jgi:hypothetical protein
MQRFLAAISMVLMGAVSPAISPMKLIVPLARTARNKRFRLSPPTTSIT